LADGKIISPKESVDDAIKKQIISKFGDDYDGVIEGLDELEFYPEGKKNKNPYLKTKILTELKWMQSDAEKIRKLTCSKLLKRFEKKGYTLG